MKLRKANALTLLVIAALLVYAGVRIVQMQTKLADAAKTQSELNAQVEELEKSNAALEYAVENADDPEIIEGVAREKLDLVMPDDRLFIDPAGEQTP